MSVPVVEVLSLEPRVLDIPHLSGSISEVQYRIGWGLTNLQKIRAVKNVERGYWALTRDGMRFRNRGDFRHKLIETFGPEPVFGGTDGRNVLKPSINVRNKKQSLLDRLYEMDPTSFENTCRSFLCKSGILRMNMLGRTSNGSFEGTGDIEIIGVSFCVYFRCRRSIEPINKNEIVNFRGTMVGRAERGLYITTGTFNNSAREEAVRDGAPPICLLEGTDLCDQLKRLHLV